MLEIAERDCSLDIHDNVAWQNVSTLHSIHGTASTFNAATSHFMGFVETCPSRSYDGISAPITVVFTVTDIELNERWATKGEIWSKLLHVHPQNAERACEVEQRELVEVHPVSIGFTC